MRVLTTQCDNPRCETLGRPESEDPYAPPYGWLQLKGLFTGCGPYVEVEVCSIDCLEDAVQEVVRQGIEAG